MLRDCCLLWCNRESAKWTDTQFHSICSLYYHYGQHLNSSPVFKVCFFAKIVTPRVFCFYYPMGDQVQRAIFMGSICGLWRHIQNPPGWPPMPNVSRVKSRQAPCQCLYWEWNSEWSFGCWCSERYTRTWNSTFCTTPPYITYYKQLK